MVPWRNGTENQLVGNRVTHAGFNRKACCPKEFPERDAVEDTQRNDLLNATGCVIEGFIV